MHLKYNKNPPEDSIPSVLLVNILSEWQLANVLGSGLERTCAATIQEWQCLAKKERERAGRGGGSKKSGFDKRRNSKRPVRRRSRKPAVKPQTPEASLLNALPPPQLNEL